MHRERPGGSTPPPADHRIGGRWGDHIALCRPEAFQCTAITQALVQLQPTDGVTAYGPAVIATLREAIGVEVGTQWSPYAFTPDGEVR